MKKRKTKKRIPKIERKETEEEKMVKYIMRKINNKNDEDKWKYLYRLGRLLNIEKAKLIQNGVDISRIIIK